MSEEQVEEQEVAYPNFYRWAAEVMGISYDEYLSRLKAEEEQKNAD